MGHRKIRGIALISTFMFVGLLFMMAAAMVVTSRNRVFTGISQHQQAQAFYLAESGLVRAMVALENDLDWPGVTDATIDGMPGTYTVEFGTDKFGSVNNIGKVATAHGYRGPDSVPKNSAVLVVQANVAGQQYVLEALVDGQGSIGYMSDAILAAGEIQSHGDFLIDGISGLDDSTPVDGSIQSNLTTGDSLVSWSGGGVAHITGTVGTGASSDTSISMAGATIDGGPELNANHQIPSHDVANEVSANDGHGAPDFSSPLAGGKHTFKPALNEKISGDIVLQDGAELYVEGDLIVLGSIKGNGTIWVDGETIFRGDAEVTTNDEFSVSLYSEGSVKLTGFDGTEFLNNVNDETRKLLRYTEHAVSEAQTIIESSPDFASVDHNRLNELNSGMGLHFLQGQQGDIITDYWAEEDLLISNAMKLLRDELSGLPDGETKNFVENRILTLEKLFSSADATNTWDPTDPNASPQQSAVDAFLADGTTAGLFDAVVDIEESGPIYADYWPQVVNLVNQVNYDKPGAAYFQGAIYTKGFFYADNEINVLGAIMVDGNGVDKQTFKRKVFKSESMGLEDGEEITLTSGDVYLGNRTRVTYVEEFFTDDASDTSGPQNLATTQWMGR